jgi:hypothetical protein
VKLRTLSDNNFTYSIRFSKATGIEVRMSLDDGITYKTVLKTGDNPLTTKFLNLIPDHVNFHVAVWDRSDNKMIKNAT